jgi:hypothetical protein
MEIFSCQSLVPLESSESPIRKAMAEHWSHNQEEEELNRRQLFQKARKGDAKAQRELAVTYGVRLWSEKERAKLVYKNPTPKRRKTQRKK